MLIGVTNLKVPPGQRRRTTRGFAIISFDGQLDTHAYLAGPTTEASVREHACKASNLHRDTEMDALSGSECAQSGGDVNGLWCFDDTDPPRRAH